jgi:hypothetical protein
MGGAGDRSKHMPKNYQPTGKRFFYLKTGEEMIYVTDNEPREELRGWLCTKQPDGQWVQRRKATDREIAGFAAFVEA